MGEKSIIIKVMNRTTNILRIIIAGFLSFLGTLSTAQAILYFLWLFGELSPTYQLTTGIIAGLIGLFVGGLITTRVMDSEDVWFAAFNGYLVGGTSAYFFLGLDILTLAVAVLSFVFAGLGGVVGLRRRTADSETPALTQEG
jgi:hypothetical protein